jgi:hypothetical protein
MNALQRHKAAWLEQIAGAKALAVALKKRIRYTGLTVRHLWDLPTLFAVQQQGIQHTDEAIGILQGRIAQLQQRLQHHERGPLMASARLLQRRRDQTAAVARKLAEAKTVEERQAAEREASQLASDVESDGMPDADVIIDGKTGQAIDAPPPNVPIIRLHKQ